MKHKKKRLLNIVNEITMQFFLAGATNIIIQINELENEYLVSMECNYQSDKIKGLECLIKALNSSRHQEVEECYWDLVGDSDVGNELSLIGMMIHRVEAKFEDNKLKLLIYKEK